MSTPHVVIVGAGITGLSAAYYLQRLQQGAGTPLRITLIEAEDRPGGKVGTVNQEGFLIDTGPDSFLAQKPWAVQLCRELGMEGEIITMTEIFAFVRRGMGEHLRRGHRRRGLPGPRHQR